MMFKSKGRTAPVSLASHAHPASALSSGQGCIAILLPLDERPETVILCYQGHYCVALEQEVPNLRGRYALAHNWQALEAEALEEWRAEREPYREGACMRASWQLERRARWNLSQPVKIQCQYSPGPRSMWRRLRTWTQGRASWRNIR
jgi:hypothetical protein